MRGMTTMKHAINIFRPYPNRSGYPYLCPFPGQYFIMREVLQVKREVS